MRSIKFRAWHSIQKKMYDPEQMGRDQLTLSVDGRGMVNVSGAHTSKSIFLNSMIPMQFTGMMDKNGREIYEGDLVKIHYPDVQSEERVETVIYREDSACFDTKWVDDWLRAHVVVIGNIYENPDQVPK